METSKKILKCDVCGKTAEAEDTSYFGGHPFQGWFILKERGGSTMLSELQRKKDWDICSAECLKKFATSPEFRKKMNKLPMHHLTDSQQKLVKDMTEAIGDMAKTVMPKSRKIPGLRK